MYTGQDIHASTLTPAFQNAASIEWAKSSHVVSIINVAAANLLTMAHGEQNENETAQEFAKARRSMAESLGLFGRHRKILSLTGHNSEKLMRLASHVAWSLFNTAKYVFESSSAT